MRKYSTPLGITAAEIKAKRKELGLTQKEFAELIGVSKPTVERWEVSEESVKGPVVLLLHLLTRKKLEAITIPDKTLPLRLRYMHKNSLCTLIDVDERRQIVRIRNYTVNRQFMAFGANEEPDFRDYEEFLKSRCFPETRDGMKLILRDLDLPFYDPFLIIEKTQGRMAEDDFWIEVER